MADTGQGGSRDHSKGKQPEESDKKQLESGNQSSPLSLMGLSEFDLSVAHMMADRENIDLAEYIKQQCREYPSQPSQMDIPPAFDSDDEYDFDQEIPKINPIADTYETASTSQAHLPPREETLFEVVVPRTNWLPIPFILAMEHFQPSFPPQPPNHLQEFTLYLTDNNNCTQEMVFVCFEKEEAYIVTEGWEQFMDRNGVKYNDTIRFCRGNTDYGPNSFRVHHVPRLEEDFELPEIPEFRPGNVLLEMDLSRRDIGFGMLEMTGAEILLRCRTDKMVKVTDQMGKDWFMIIYKCGVAKKYMITGGWFVFEREHQLEAGDMVRFYMPVYPEHENHFLVECVKEKKKEEDGSDPSQRSDGARPSCSRKGKEKVDG